jgi:sugar phosphate isomerase/epimerase
MRLTISNLAWQVQETATALRLLKGLGAGGVEVAPTRIADWDQLNEKLLRDYRSRVEEAGLAVSSLQAILFGKPNATLLGDGDSFRLMLEHMATVADIAETLGAGVLVFGAPRNRLRGALRENEALELARERFGQLGDLLERRPVVIGIEPVPPTYGGDFLTSAQSVLGMVESVGHRSIRVHLDTGCVKLGGDAIADAIHAAGDRLCHFHAAEPNLGDFAAPAMDHAAASKALGEVHYQGWIAIEMREAPTEPLKAVEQAIRWVSDTYSQHATMA